MQCKVCESENTEVVTMDEDSADGHRTRIVSFLCCNDCPWYSEPAYGTWRNKGA